MLGVARSSFYDWRDRATKTTTTEQRRARLREQIAGVFHGSRGTYGCRRVAAALNRRGVACSVGLVAELMRELDLQACQPRAYRVTTINGGRVWHRPDLIERDFTSDAPGDRFVGDITYLRTGQGWLYLATVIDLATRMVVGWQLADHMRTSLVIDALEMARLHGHLNHHAVFHSDRGTQYSSTEFARYCNARSIQPSVGRTGVCWDNAAAESFFATLKNEMYSRERFATKARARFAVAEYIEVFYNRQRLHSALGYRTPAEALADHKQLPTAA